MADDYWGKRLADKAYNSKSDEMLKQLRKIYKEQGKEIQAKIIDLYLKMLEDGSISTTNLYVYGRYTELIREINDILSIYGEKEIKVISDGLEAAYKETFEGTSETLGDTVKWGLQNTYVMEEVINANFKGANFSNRIWNNRNSLLKTLEKNIQNVVASGQNKDTAVKQIMDIEKASFSNADRLVRTETMRVINDGQKESYKQNRYTHGYYVVSNDDRLCEECNTIAKRTKANPEPLETMEGIHHPRCRCTIIPIVPHRTLKEINDELLKKQRENDIIKKNKNLGLNLQFFAKIPEEKFTKYALDPVKQPDKARAFKEALGYTLENYSELITNIKENVNENALAFKKSNEQGALYEYVMRLTGINGKQANVCTGWIIENGEKEPRLTSAYVTKKKVTENDKTI